MAENQEQTKMETNQQQEEAVSAQGGLESVQRIYKLPIVESTIQTATNVYEKVKDYNSVTNWTLSTAESAVSKVVEVGKPIAEPIVHKLDGPIKTVDGYICTGLDYVEEKVPAVKLPPGEIYSNTKEMVNNNTVVQKAKDMVEPAVATITAAKYVVDPYVNAGLEKAKEVLHISKNDGGETSNTPEK